MFDKQPMPRGSQSERTANQTVAPLDREQSRHEGFDLRAECLGETPCDEFLGGTARSRTVFDQYIVRPARAAGREFVRRPSATEEARDQRVNR